MSKIFAVISTVALVAAAFLFAFVPSAPPSADMCGFHPHMDQFKGGDPNEVVKMLQNIENSIEKFSVFALKTSSAELARWVISGSYAGKSFLLIINSNPTLYFFDKPNVDKTNRAQEGLTRMSPESSSQMTQAKNVVSCLKSAYAELNGIKLPAPAKAPVTVSEYNPRVGALFLLVGAVVGYLAAGTAKLVWAN